MKTTKQPHNNPPEVTDEDTKAILDFVIVTPETHFKVLCRCPECFTTFNQWFDKRHAENVGADEFEDMIIRDMLSQVTECSACRDEAISNREIDELLDHDPEDEK